MFHEEDKPTFTREFFAYWCGVWMGLPAAFIAIVFAVSTNFLVGLVYAFIGALAGLGVRKGSGGFSIPIVGICAAMSVCLVTKFFITVILGSRIVESSWLVFVVHYAIPNPKSFFEIAVLNSWGSVAGFGIAAVASYRLAMQPE